MAHCTHLEERGLGGIQSGVSWGNHHINRSDKPHTGRSSNLSVSLDISMLVKCRCHNKIQASTEHQ
jgi:hypothetical protein